MNVKLLITLPLMCSPPLRQALQMMRRVPVAGPGLQLTRDGTAVVPIAGVHVPHLSPGSLHSLLQSFAAAATDALLCATFSQYL